MDLLHELDNTLLAWLILAGPVVLAGGLLWLTLPRGRRELLPPQRERAVPWTGVDVIVVFLGLVLWPGLVFSLLQPDNGTPSAADRLFPRILAQAGGYLLLLITSLAFLVLYVGARPYQLGIHASRWRQGLVLGAVAWLMGAPFIHAVHALAAWLNRLFQEAPAPRHDLVVMLEQRATAPDWALLILLAVLLGPLTEEFIFRGVIQRWAGRAAVRSYLLFAAALLIAPFINGQAVLECLAFFLALAPGYQYCPLLFAWVFPIRGRFKPAGDVDHWRVESPAPVIARRTDFWDRLAEDTLGLFDPARQDPRITQPRAVYTSAALFASMHSWPDMVPLFFLGLLLGWVAYRTQSLVAPIMLHMLFNTVGCIHLVMTL
jgi:membrane protease YdiL (CAAX protease family)